MPAKRRCAKKRYRDEAAALWAITNIGARGEDRGKRPIHAYLCPRCRGWHLTSMRLSCG